MHHKLNNNSILQYLYLSRHEICFCCFHHVITHVLFNILTCLYIQILSELKCMCCTFLIHAGAKFPQSLYRVSGLTITEVGCVDLDNSVHV